jgi:hypothetical protein
VLTWNGSESTCSREDAGRGGGVSKEVEVLDTDEGEEVTDGITEDEEGSPTFSGSSGGETGKRWTGIVRCVVGADDAMGRFLPYLRSLIQSTKRGPVSSSPPSRIP